MKIKRNVVAVLLLAVLVVLGACSNEDTQEVKKVESVAKDEKKQATPQIQERPKVEEPTETMSVASEEKEPAEEPKEPETTKLKTYITEKEFNKKFKFDSEEKQYKNGKFKLIDGTIVHADDYSYGECDLFDFAMATFYKGKLAHIQMDTTKSISEIESALGVQIKGNATVDPTIGGYEIIFNDTFADENIQVFPNEWD